MPKLLDELPDTPLPAFYGGYQQLKLSRSEGILTIGLNRPSKKNAIGVEMTLELERAMLACALDKETHIVVFHGLGDNFSTGMDMRDFFDHSDRDPEVLARARRATDNWRAKLMRNLPQVRLVVVQGYCLGGAWPIVECADIVLCTETAIFGLPEINFGFVPGGPIAKSNRACLSLKTGNLAALTGRPFGASEALQKGMVSKVVPQSQIDREALQLAKHIRTKFPEPVTFL